VTDDIRPGGWLENSLGVRLRSGADDGLSWRADLYGAVVGNGATESAPRSTTADIHRLSEAVTVACGTVGLPVIPCVAVIASGIGRGKVLVGGDSPKIPYRALCGFREKPDRKGALDVRAMPVHRGGAGMEALKMNRSNEVRCVIGILRVAGENGFLWYW